MEKRRDKRFPFTITLRIEELYKQDNVKLELKNEDFKVVDLSKSGIGFDSEHELPLDFYFNAKITIDEKNHFYSVLKIIRKIDNEGSYHYGCEFVGLADILSSVVDDLEE